jgi:hypothetical protein
MAEQWLRQTSDRWDVARLWALPVGVLIHNLEEYPRIVDFAERHGVPMNRRAMGFAVGLATLLPAPFTVWAVTRPHDPRPLQIVLAIAAGMAANGVTHAMQTIVLRDYSPGTLTGIVLLIPLARQLFHQAHRCGILSAQAIRRSAVLGVALMVPTALALRITGAGLSRLVSR